MQSSNRLDINRKMWWIIAPLILCALVIISYAPSVFYPFQFDDLANIVKLFSIRNNNLSAIFFKNTRWISYWLNALFYQMGAFNPLVYRVGNITIHLITGLLMFSVFSLACSRLRKKQLSATQALLVPFCAAGLFLLHPVQTQTVSYVIQGQLEGMVALGVMSMLLCFLLSTHAVSRLGRNCLLGLLFGLSFLICGTKEVAIVAPILLLIFDWFFVAQADVADLKKRLWIHGTVFTIVLSTYLYLMKPAFFVRLFGLSLEMKNNFGNILTTDPDQHITALHYCISEFKVILHYMWIFLWPFSISVDYDWMLVQGFFSLDCIVPFIVLCLMGLYIARRVYRQPTDLISFGIIWFMAAILPRASILPSSELLADYKTYTASIGLLWVFGIFLSIFVIGLGRRLAIKQPIGYLVITICCLLPIGYALYARNTVWSTAEKFWHNIVQHAPTKARAYNNYAVALCEQGRHEESIKNLKCAIRLDDQYADPYNNLAVAYGILKQVDLAIAALKQSIRLYPTQPEAYNNLGSFLLQKKDLETAIKMISIAVKLRPHYGKAYFNMGRAYFELGQQEKAWECFRDACMKADLDNEFGFDSYAKMSFLLRKYDEAAAAYEKVVSLNPHAVDALLHLGHIHFINRNYTQALAWYWRAMPYKPKDAATLFQIADCYLGLEDYATALPHYQRVIELDAGFALSYLRIARCHDKRGERDVAIAKLEHFLTMDPPKKFKKAAEKTLQQLRSGSSMRDVARPDAVPPVP